MCVIAALASPTLSHAPLSSLVANGATETNELEFPLLTLPGVGVHKCTNLGR